MKKLVLTLTATLACVAAFAQGKVAFVNNSLHAVYFSTDTSRLLGSDAGRAGSAVVSTDGISYDLFAGTSQASMTKVATTTMDGTTAPGTWKQDSVILPFAAGSGQFFEIFAYTTGAGSFTAASGGTGLYYGDSGVFTATSGGSIIYNNLTLATSPSFSTWAPGTQQVSGSVAGAMGAIEMVANVVSTPEPTSLALFGLGAAGLMIFRRRK